jgi:O-methyltransferase
MSLVTSSSVGYGEGTCILMRAVLAADGDEKRRVWLADSFAGVPPLDPDSYIADQNLRLDLSTDIPAVSEATVMANFERYRLLDGRARTNC